MPNKLSCSDFTPVAVIGAGLMGRRYVEVLSQIVGPQQVSVSDASSVLAEAVADKHNLSGGYTNYEHQFDIEKPRVCHIAEPTTEISSIIQTCIQRGIHLTSEIALTDSLDTLENLITEAESQNVWVVQNFHTRFDSELEKLTKDVGAKTFGEICHVDVQLNVDFEAPSSPYLDVNAPPKSLNHPAGPALDFLPKLVSTAYTFVGAHQKVFCLWRNDLRSQLRFDDLRATTECEHGTAHLTLSSRARPEGLWIQIHGTKGKVTRELEMPEPASPLRQIAHAAIYNTLGKSSLSSRRSSAIAVHPDDVTRTLTRTYQAFERGTPPIRHNALLATHRWIHAMLEQVPQS